MYVPTPYKRRIFLRRFPVQPFFESVFLKKNVPWHILAAGRASDILPFRCSAIRAERFYFIGRILGQFTRNYTQTTKRGLLTTNKG